MATYSITCEANKSALIRQAYPQTNYSTGDTMDAGTESNNGQSKIAIIGFGIPDELKKKRITAARLSVCIAAGNQINGAIVLKSGYSTQTPFYENEITWNNANVPGKENIQNINAWDKDNVVSMPLAGGSSDEWANSTYVELEELPALLAGTAFWPGWGTSRAIYSSRSSRKPYYRITAEDAEPEFSQMMPAGGYVDRKTPQTFSWVARFSGIILEDISQMSARVVVTDPALGTEQVFTVSGGTETCNIPANTLPVGPFNWRVEADYDSGMTFESGTVEATTATNTPIVSPVSPADTYVYGEYETEFRWNYAAADAQPQTRIDLQYSADGVAWTDFFSAETDRYSCTVPPLSLPAGKLWWRARGWNTHGAGDWSEGAQIIVQSIPSVPVILGVTEKSRPVVTWQSIGQICYELQIERENQTIYQTGEVASNAFVHVVPVYLDDGAYTARLRYKNSSLKFSDWAERPFEIRTQKPAPPVLSGAAGAGYAKFAIAETGGSFKFYLLRDGVPIAKIDRLYTDYSCVGTHRYILRGVDEFDNFSDSEPVDVTIELGCFAVISPSADVSDMLRIKYRRAEQAVHSGRLQATGERTHYSGRKYPVYEFGGFADEQVTVSASFRDGEGAARLENWMSSGQVILYREKRGHRCYGVISSMGLERDWFSTDVTVSIDRVDYMEEISYDPPEG